MGTGLGPEAPPREAEDAPGVKEGVKSQFSNLPEAAPGGRQVGGIYTAAPQQESRCGSCSSLLECEGSGKPSAYF